MVLDGAVQALAGLHFLIFNEEIGRASCRERV